MLTCTTLLYIDDVVLWSSGVTACVVTLALEVLAEEGVGVGASRHVYDGSWTQYASDPAAQIVKSC